MSHLETECGGGFHLAGELAKQNTTHLLDKIENGRVIGYGMDKIFFSTNIQDKNLKDVTNILSGMNEYIDQPSHTVVSAKYLRNWPHIPFAQEIDCPHQLPDLLIAKPASLLMTAEYVYISSVERILVDGRHTNILFNSLDDYVNN